MQRLMKFKLIIVILLTTNVFASEFDKKSLILSQKIFCLIKNTHIVIFKNEEFTSKFAIAVALTESSLGKNLDNDFEKSYGIFQNNLKTLKNRYASLNYVKECLKSSFLFNFINFLIEVFYWKKYLIKNHNLNVYALLRHYNGGFNYNKKLTDRYIFKYRKNFALLSRHWDKIKSANCLQYESYSDFLGNFFKYKKLFFIYKKGYCYLSFSSKNFN